MAKSSGLSFPPPMISMHSNLRSMTWLKAFAPDNQLRDYASRMPSALSNLL
jgi:hypothetical protein